MMNDDPIGTVVDFIIDSIPGLLDFGDTLGKLVWGEDWVLEGDEGDEGQ